jgi:tetratricopeptide (TPR) repeat protein
MGRKKTEKPKRNPKRRLFWIILAAVVAAGLIWLMLTMLGFWRIARELPVVADGGRKSDLFRTRYGEFVRRGRSLPPDAQKIGDLGKFLQANLHFAEAESCYRIAVRLEPRNPRWYYYQAIIAMKRGEGGAVVDLLRRVRTLAPDYGPAALKVADGNFKIGKHEEAEAGYRALVDRPDEAPYAYLGLARVAIARDRWDLAQGFLEKAIGSHPEFGAAHRMLATVHEHYGRLEEMGRSRDRSGIYRTGEVVDPWMEELDALYCDSDELMRLADSELQAQRYTRAYRLFKQALEMDPANIGHLFDVALTLYKEGNREEAIRFFGRIIATDPNHRLSFFYLGMALIQKGELNQAETVFRRLLGIDAQSADALVGLGEIEFFRKNHDAAEVYLRKALKLNPQSASAYLVLGNIAVTRGDDAGAFNAFEHALRLDSRMPEAHLAIGAILVRRHRIDGAIDHYQRALRENPYMGIVHYNLGNAYFRQGRFPDAEEQYREAIIDEPDLAEAHLNLGTILERKGDTAGAILLYEKAEALALSSGDSGIAAKISDCLRAAREKRGPGSR